MILLRHILIVLPAILLLPGCSKPPPPPPTVVMESLDPNQAKLINERREAVMSSPGSAAAWGALGQGLNAVEYYPEAAFCYEEAARLDANSPKWPHLLGLLQLQDKPDEAILNLTRAAQLAGTQPDAPRLRLVQALIERGRHDEAEAALAPLLAADPLHPGARLEMARIHLVRNALAPAAEALQPCLSHPNTGRPAFLLLAQIRQRQGSVAEAAELAGKATRMPRQFDWPDPYLREVYALRADKQKLQDRANALLMARKFPEAEAVLAQLLTAYPGDAGGLLLLGRLRFQQRQCPQAEHALRAHLAANPESLNGLIQLALSILCQERWDDGAEVLRQAITIKPDFAKAHYNLGYALSRKGDPNGAIRAFGDALRCSPGDVGTHLALADELIRAKRRADAEHHLKRALLLDPANAKARQLQQAIRNAGQ